MKRCPGTTYEKPVLCLNSGGIDSLVLQAHIKAQGFIPYSLFIDYGQPAREREQAAAQKIAAFYGGKFYTERVRLEIFKQPPFSSSAAHSPIFFSIAAAYCDTLNIPRMGLGWKQKRKGLKIMTPLLEKTKLNIARLGAKYAAPFELSWSCQGAGSAPCGECPKCTKRNSVLERIARGSGAAGPRAAGSRSGS
ncbi:MAG: 7-cyano-7-deazaguanine synthase [Vulcanimicrobiaceae bacterium]